MDTIKKYAHALAELKSAPFDKIHLLVVKGDLIKMLATWPLVSRTIVSADQDTKTGIHLAWDMTRFDVREWASLAYVDKDFIWKSWRGLARANLIYPDGTMPDKVTLFLKKRAD